RHLLDHPGLHRLPEAGPARARLELDVAAEQGRVAHDAPVGALVVAVPVHAGEGLFGPRLLGDAPLQVVESVPELVGVNVGHLLLLEVPTAGPGRRRAPGAARRSAYGCRGTAPRSPVAR